MLTSRRTLTGNPIHPCTEIRAAALFQVKCSDSKWPWVEEGMAFRLLKGQSNFWVMNIFLFTCSREAKDQSGNVDASV